MLGLSVLPHNKTLARGREEDAALVRKERRRKRHRVTGSKEKKRGTEKEKEKEKEIIKMASRKAC